LLVLSSLVFSTTESVEISSDILKKAEKYGEVEVIIKFKESVVNNKLNSSERLEIKKEEIARSRKKIFRKLPEQGFEIIRTYNLTNTIKAKVNKQALNELRNNPDIEWIHEDIPVKAFLDQSIPIINATGFWNVLIENISVNGSGETVCVLDTGIDYTHPALGGCTVTNETQSGNNESFSSESIHPYSNNMNQIYKINYTGFTQISVHFVNISTEAEWDYIEVLDPNNNNNTIAIYTGDHENVWTPSVEGDTIYVKLESDTSVTGWGFLIDQVINGTVNSTVNWSSCEKVIGGWDLAASTTSQDDQDPRDDAGHGTHVSGIIASMNETYTGVAPGAKIVSMKVLDSGGSGNTTDVLAAIEYCIENKDRYNISVITMSLGSGAYSSNCDSNSAFFTLFSQVVDEALTNGIIVIAASGNEATSTTIAFPACLENITSVGSTTKADVIDTSYSNSAGILDLVAPGTAIRSTLSGGDFGLDSGTSMAAPHVAGAALLLRNFKRLENGSILGSLEMRDILIATGDNKTDSRNSLKFPRINLTVALNYIDDTPRITFVQGNESTNISVNSSFVNITTSEPVNATIEVDAVNYSMSGSNKVYYYNITNLSSLLHNYTVHVTDPTNNLVSSDMFFLEVDTVKPNITDVVNITINQTEYEILFNTSEQANITIFYGESSGSYSSNTSNSSLLTSHNITLSGLIVNSTYYYYISASDEGGNANETSEYNFSTSYIDIFAPTWSNMTVNPDNNSVYSSSQQYQFNITWEDYNLSSVWIEHNFTGSYVNYSITGNTSTVFYYNYTGLAGGVKYWRMYANDTNGYTNNTDLFGYNVQKANSSVNLTINNTVQNYSVEKNTVLLLNGTRITGDSNIRLYIDGSLINTSEIIVNNYTFNYVGNVNVTLVYPESQNYSFNFSTLFVNVTDTVAPVINISYPDNDSIINQSYQVDLNFTTNENTTCLYFVNESVNLTGPRNYSTNYSVYANEYRNITINCTDLSNNSASSILYYTINDTIQPNITTSSSTSDTSSITINFNTTEPTNRSVILIGEDSTTNINFGLVHSVTFSSLSSSTTYSYNVTVCDRLGNCNTTQGSKATTTPESSSSSSSSGGGGGSSSSSTTTTATVAKQTFQNPVKGKNTMKITSTNIALTDVSFNLRDNVQKTVQVTVEKTDLPQNIPNLDNVYQIFKIDKTQLTESEITTADFEFKVPVTWLTNNSIDPDTIGLYRYTSKWTKLNTEKLSEDSEFYYYKATSPGFSYFSIKGDVIEEAIEEEVIVEEVMNKNISRTVKAFDEQPTVVKERQSLDLLCLVIFLTTFASILYLVFKH